MQYFIYCGKCKKARSLKTVIRNEWIIGCKVLKLVLCVQISDCGMVLEEQPGKVSEAFRLFLQGEGYGKWDELNSRLRSECEMADDD